MRISDWSSDVCSSDLERDARTKYYRLAPAWQAVEVLRTDAAARFIERAQPHMARFAQQSEAAMGLWKIVSRDRIQLTARAESDAATRLSLADDQRQPLGGGAAGRDRKSTRLNSRH